MQNQNLVKPEQKAQIVWKSLLQIKNDIAKILPKYVSPDRLIRMAYTTFRKNPKLWNCDPKSFIGAILQATQLGLEIDDLLGHAYLVPYKDKIQLVIGYRGLIDLARRSGEIKHIQAYIVYENEPFEIEYGTQPKIKHKPLPPEKRGKMIGAYAIAILKDNSVIFEFMWKEDIEKVKEQSKYKDSPDSPWIRFEEEMIKKTVIRRLAKILPLSPEDKYGKKFVKASIYDEYTETGVETPVEIEINGYDVNIQTNNKEENIEYDKETGEVKNIPQPEVKQNPVKIERFLNAINNLRENKGMDDSKFIEFLKDNFKVENLILEENFLRQVYLKLKQI